MRDPILTLLAIALVVTPLAAAELGSPQRYEGPVTTDSSLVHGLLRCHDTTWSRLTLAPRLAPEHADVTLETGSACEPRAVRTEARLEGGGWRLGDGEIVRGWLHPLGDGKWDLDLMATTCPPATICEFPLGRVTFAGTLEGLVTTQ